MRILLAEHPHVAGFTAEGLREQGHVVELARTAREAAAEGRSGRYDVLVLASAGTDLDGMAVLRELRNAGVSTPAVLLTPGALPPPVDLGACDTLSKPFSVPQLVERIATLL